MLRAEVGGLSVAYERTGDGPALILLHGFTQDSRVWRPQLESLSDKSVIDLLGIKFLAAATVMRDEVRSGRLDASVTETVVAAAEGLPSRPRAGPSVLSQREADVLDELARGRTTRRQQPRSASPRRPYGITSNTPTTSSTPGLDRQR